MKNKQDSLNILHYILTYRKLSHLLDNSSTLTDLCKCFDYTIEKLAPKCFIKLRMAALYSKVYGESLSECFAGNWFCSLFTTEFPTDFELQILDGFLLGGWSQLFKIGIALIKMNESIIVK